MTPVSSFASVFKAARKSKSEMDIAVKAIIVAFLTVTFRELFEERRSVPMATVLTVHKISEMTPSSPSVSHR